MISHKTFHHKYDLGSFLNQIRTLLRLTVNYLSDSKELHLDNEESKWNINVYVLT